MSIDNYPLDFQHLYVSCYVGAFFMVNRLKGYKVENVEVAVLVSKKKSNAHDITILCCSLSDRAGNDKKNAFLLVLKWVLYFNKSNKKKNSD